MDPNDWRYHLQRAEQEALTALQTGSAAAADIHRELSRLYSARAIAGLLTLDRTRRAPF